MIYFGLDRFSQVYAYLIFNKTIPVGGVIQNFAKLVQPFLSFGSLFCYILASICFSGLFTILIISGTIIHGCLSQFAKCMTAKFDPARAKQILSGYARVEILLAIVHELISSFILVLMSFGSFASIFCNFVY